MSLPVHPPIAPMLARLTRSIPVGAVSYEPKWDGFRCLAFVDDVEVDLRSRHDRPLARYFPELVAAFSELRDGRPREASEQGFALDGEILLADLIGRSEGVDQSDVPVDFARLMSRLHPAASRVDRLSREIPARYVAFDLLAVGSADLRNRPFSERRRALEDLLDGGEPAIAITPTTRDPAVASGWLDRLGRNVDGVVAKPDDLPYAAGKRVMTKVKRERTAECVVAGVRLLPDGLVSSLLLGLYDQAGALRHVGVVTQMSRSDRATLLEQLAPFAMRLDQHPWRNGFLIGASPLGRLAGSASRWTPDMERDWLPIRPERVVEVGFDQVDGDRFRHPARLIRWRPDRSATSCLLTQITGDAGAEPALGDRIGSAVS
jgi:ATP-dependent DNA ligase